LKSQYRDGFTEEIGGKIGFFSGQPLHVVVFAPVDNDAADSAFDEDERWARLAAQQPAVLQALVAYRGYASPHKVLLCLPEQKAAA
jgi:hypothetical protein